MMCGRNLHDSGLLAHASDWLGKLAYIILRIASVAGIIYSRALVMITIGPPVQHPYSASPVINRLLNFSCASEC